MVSGYSFSNKNNSIDDIKVFDENNPNIITYSKALITSICKTCRNSCPYCGYHKKDTLAVPYTTIKFAKKARKFGAREVIYTAGERPDKFPHIRSVLDLWGFNSYIDYIYTICELGFLEGLIPIVDIGFLTPKEMKQLSEISALLRIFIDSCDPSFYDTKYRTSPGKKLEIKLKNLSWAGKLKIPVSTGFLIGIGETSQQRKNILNQIAQIQNQFGNIHDVILQNFIPEPKTKFENLTPPSKETMLETAQMALEILPSDIKIIVPVEFNPDIEDFIKLGIRDIGSIHVKPTPYISQRPQIDIDELNQRLNNIGFQLQQRFPIGFDYIRNGKYSKKLGQIFDSYRYKIKKEEQEKLKDSKIISHENKK